MTEAQIGGHLCRQGVEHGIADKAKNVVRTVAFRPFHRLDAAIVAVAAPDDACVRPMSA
jgi:hypothetical protein